MAVLNTSFLTLSDIAKQTDPDGTVSPIIELLGQMNEMLDDIPWIEGNLVTGHRTTVRTKLPDVYLRGLNEGTRVSKAGNNQIDETTSIIEGWSEVDEELLRLSSNPAQTRLNEDSGFVESMNQKCQELLIYGNHGNDPKEFNGVHVRYDELGGNDAGQIIDAGGTGSDNTSIWLVGWSPITVHGVYGKHGVAGLETKDWGTVVVEETDADSNPTRIVKARSQFIWRPGIAVRDYRYVVRIANIDVSNAVTETSAADLIKLMSRAMERIYSMNGVRPAFYMNRAIKEVLRVQEVTKTTNSTLRMGEIYGRPVLMAGGVPIRCIDRILNTEARIV